MNMCSSPRRCSQLYKTLVLKSRRMRNRRLGGENLLIFSFVLRSCLKDFVKLPLEWDKKRRKPKGFDTKWSSAQKSRTTEHCTTQDRHQDWSVFCTHSQWSTVQLLVHSPPAMGFASKGSIKYIIKILLHGESGKAAELYIFYQLIRFSIHSCSTVFKSFSTKDLVSLRKALPTGKIFAQRICSELQAATTAVVFKHFRICSSKYLAHTSQQLGWMWLIFFFWKAEKIISIISTFQPCKEENI